MASAEPWWKCGGSEPVRSRQADRETTMTGKNLTLYVANYADAASATDDFSALKSARDEGLERVVDVAGSIRCTHATFRRIDLHFGAFSELCPRDCLESV